MSFLCGSFKYREILAVDYCYKTVTQKIMIAENTSSHQRGRALLLAVSFAIALIC